MSETLTSLPEMQHLIDTEPALAVYYSSASCQVCHVLWPRLEGMLQQAFPRMRLVRVSADVAPELAAQSGVLSIPTLVVYLDHRELRRYVRQISVEGVRQDLLRPYGMMFDGP